ncbi:hypothetical protein C8Q79DRAFT_901495 [Trametes meyenii]|nr:hypothetical protein C8Q79DRAFT_901495 [Trametes meyenii]
MVLVIFELPKHAMLLRRMGPVHMSDDETDGDEVKHQAKYRIVISEWQSEALRNFLWTLDRLWREHWAKPTHQWRTPGNMPRLRRLRPDSKTKPGEAPPGLWRNCYDIEWLKTLKPFEREQLDVLDADYDFSIPKPILVALAEAERRSAEQKAAARQKQGTTGGTSSGQ